MPIRRAAGTPPQEKPPPNTAEKEADAEADEYLSADEEPATSSAPAGGDEGGEPQENGNKMAGQPKEEKGDEAEKKNHGFPAMANGERCKDCTAGQCATHCYVLLLRLKDGYKLERTKVKKVKRTIPAWASVGANKKIPIGNFSGIQPKVDEVLIEAIRTDKSGISFNSLMKYIMKKYPSMDLDKKKFLIKKAMKRQLEKGTIKQLKGKGLSGSFAIGKSVTKPAAKKSSASSGMTFEALGDSLPLIVTRLCEPKEASYILIRKYLEQHFPHFSIDKRPDLLKSALTRGIEKNQLERITGKGANGTFKLKRVGDRSGLKPLEKAITTAITAMNEPKTCGTNTLRKYLVDHNKDTEEQRIVANLKRALTKCKMLGWMEQITGNGLNGTYQLCFPYYPSPAILFPDEFVPPKESAVRKRRLDATKEKGTPPISDSEEESEQESEEESDDEPPPPKRKPQKRPPPKVRKPLPNKKPRSARQSKPASSAKKVVSRTKRSAPPAKKAATEVSSTPVKDAPEKKATPAKKAAPAKKESPVKKASPEKKAAPAKKPKTPAVKKLVSRGSKRPTAKKSSPKEPVAKKETNTKPSTRKSQRGKSERCSSGSE